jgi:hemolysin III
VWLRRLDHAAIFVLIAGSSTPLAVLALPPTVGDPLLVGVWVGALAGVVLKLWRLGAANRVGSWLYATLGWAQALAFPALVTALGPGLAAVLLASGITYTAGAVVLVRRRPDPWPGVFGYHEVWHLAVVVASALHLVVVLDVARAAG